MVTMKQLILISEIYVVWRKRLVFSKSLVFIWCLALAHGFVEYRVVNILIDFLDKMWSEENLRRAAILTNLQDGLSSILVVYTHALAAYTGRFSVIIFCTASYVMGLMLFWAAILASKVGFFISVAAILLIALGNAGVPAIQAFIDYQLREVVRVRQSTEKNKETPQADTSAEENDHVIRVNIWQRSARILGALIATISPDEMSWSDTFKNAAIALVSSYLLFFSAYILFALEAPAAIPLTKFSRVFKAALWKLGWEYPVNLEGYYWKNHIQNPKLTYSDRLGKVRLLPRVSSLWRWLDKAAIIKERQPPNPSLESPGMNGDLCTVREVREVKRFASFILIYLTLLPYGMVMAAGNTFFVQQTNNLRENLKINALFLLKSILRDIVLFLIWMKNITNLTMTKVRIGVGMVCAVLCCLTAWLVELRRLSLVKQEGVVDHPDGEISMGTAALVPQFLLLGLMEALVDNGLEQLFDNYVPESMRSFGLPFSELVFGVGKLLTIPFASIITGWFKESMNTSHLDWYYLMLAILNFGFIFIYGYYSTKYKEDYPEDEELSPAEMPEITESIQQASAEMQEITEIGQQASQEETHGKLQ